MTETREIKLESWDRFSTPNLDIEYNLIGRSHTFSYMGATVILSLPNHERMGEGRDDGYVHEWRTVDGGENIPRKAFVFVADVCVQRGDGVALPAEVLERHPNAFDLISKDDQKTLNGLVVESSDIASNAFEYWLSIMRWKSGDYRIGRPGIPNTTQWSTYLRESGSLKRVWIGPHVIQVPASHAVTENDWETVQLALQTSTEVPIHIKFFDDAQEAFGRHEFRRSIIDLAIACEIFMRTMVLRRIPSDLDPDVRVMLEEANINQYVRKFFPNLLTEEGKKRFKGLANDHLGSLFDARNKIMHMAEGTRATGENCFRFSRAAQTLFEVGAMTA
ncbi:hypothetical protein OKW49_005961 [Paraburkholderia youngii]|uniref:hypothetical protein n=1 Tax=Paraburkholderia youngii TaxID=2782701 RepID=UPI003D25238E